MKRGELFDLNLFLQGRSPEDAAKRGALKRAIPLIRERARRAAQAQLAAINALGPVLEATAGVLKSVANPEGDAPE